MSDDVVVENGQQAEVTENRRVRKKVPIDKDLLLRDIVCKTKEEIIYELLACVLYNIKDMHLPSAKLFIDVVNLLRSKEEASPEEAYDSLAKVLMGLYQKQLTGALLDEPEVRLVQVASLDLEILQEGMLSLE